MIKHWRYLKYLLRHKWYVFVACMKIAPRELWWRAIIHDWSKFLPSEWLPYAWFFYGPTKLMREQAVQQLGYDPFRDREEIRREFSAAWNHHQKRNKHHWQYWVLLNDKGTIDTVEMPRKYLLEMYCDWVGAGKAIGKSTVEFWYNQNRHLMRLHPTTRLRIEELILHLPEGTLMQVDEEHFMRA